VQAHFEVGVDGRVSDCRVVRSSGNAELDATTCRLIERRFRYAPARDAQGRAVPDVAGWEEEWWIGKRRRGR
jgi:protein TonB